MDPSFTAKEKEQFTARLRGWNSVGDAVFTKLETMRPKSTWTPHEKEFISVLLRDGCGYAVGRAFHGWPAEQTLNHHFPDDHRWTQPIKKSLREVRAAIARGGQEALQVLSSTPGVQVSSAQEFGAGEDVVKVEDATQNPRCSHCGTLEAGVALFKKCGRCKKAYYCDREHQKLHWPVHRQECQAA